MSFIFYTVGQRRHQHPPSDNKAHQTEVPSLSQAAPHKPQGRHNNSCQRLVDKLPRTSHKGASIIPASDLSIKDALVVVSAPRARIFMHPLDQKTRHLCNGYFLHFWPHFDSQGDPPPNHNCRKHKTKRNIMSNVRQPTNKLKTKLNTTLSSLVIIQQMNSKYTPCGHHFGSRFDSIVASFGSCGRKGTSTPQVI